MKTRLKWFLSEEKCYIFSVTTCIYVGKPNIIVFAHSICNMQVKSIILTVDMLKEGLFELSDLGGANLVPEASDTALQSET